MSYGSGLPYDLREGIALNESSFYVVEQSWSTKGAQEFPFGTVVVDGSKLSSIMNETSVLYLGGPSGEHLITFRTL